MAMPEHIKKKLGKRLVSTTDRTGMFEGYRLLKREHEKMKQQIASLLVRVRRLEGLPDSPPDSPTDSPP